MEWVDTLTDEIDELLANDRSVKFNTHKNRKRIMGTVKSLIKAAVTQNKLINPQDLSQEPPAPSNGIRIKEGVITRPNPDGGRGFAVMTESDSSKNDDVHKAHVPGTPMNRDAIKSNNAGMRKW